MIFFVPRARRIALTRFTLCFGVKSSRTETPINSIDSTYPGIVVLSVHFRNL